MNLIIDIPDQEKDLIVWLNNIKTQGNNFNDKIVSMLKTYQHLVQNVEWSVFDKSVEDRWDTFEDKLHGNLDGITSKFNQKIDLFQMQLQESISKPIQGEFQKLQQTIDVFRGDSRVSSAKGKIGELQIENQIETYFPDSEITDCSKQAHQSDFHLKLYGFTIFVEVKTYQKNVPQKEIEKFYRDLEENPNAQGGILLSLTSGISNKPTFTYEINPATKKPIVYVPNASVLDGGNTVIWAVLFITLILKYQETHGTSGSDGNMVSLDDTIEMIKNQLQWVQLTIDNIASLKDIALKHFTCVTQEAERFHKDIHRKLEDSEKVLKKNVESWNEYLSNGTKVILPLPSISQQQQQSGKGYTCTCGKAYKTERNYITHKQECRQKT